MKVVVKVVMKMVMKVVLKVEGCSYILLAATSRPGMNRPRVKESVNDLVSSNVKMKTLISFLNSDSRH